MRASLRRGLILFGGLAGCLVAGRAGANGLEVPENGVDIMGRGGAFVARADNPLAVSMNPAGLAGQPTGIMLTGNFTWQSMCFQRAGSYASGGSTANTTFTSSYQGQPYPEVCKENKLGNVNIVPNVSFVYQITEKLGVALAVVTPSGAGKAKWPLAVNPQTGAHVDHSEPGAAPAPQRYMLLERNGSILLPTIAAGYEIIPGVRFGAAFQAGITIFKSAVSSHGSASSASDVAEGPNADTKSEISFTKFFTPAFILGALVSATDEFDIGGMFRYSSDIVSNDAKVKITAPVYGRGTNPQSTPAETNLVVKEFRIAQPWDARLGFRWHPWRKGAKAEKKKGYRDFLDNDLFDIEVDFTYSKNKSFDKIHVLFDPGQFVRFGSTATASELPPDASIDKRWKDVVGVRIGGEYAVIQSKLGVRAGGFFQTAGQEVAYLNIDFHPGQMFGLYLGATMRLHKMLDLGVGYGHIFVKTFDNGGNGQLRGLVGARRPSGEDTGASICPANPPPPDYRTCLPTNGGKVSSSYNMFSLGLTARF